MTESALLKKRTIPIDFLENQQVYEIDVVIHGGGHARIQTTSKTLADEVVTELKAIGVFHRQPVKIWEHRIIPVAVQPTAKKQKE
jgi:hypothetical protein